MNFARANQSVMLKLLQPPGAQQPVAPKKGPQISKGMKLGKTPMPGVTPPLPAGRGGKNQVVAVGSRGRGFGGA